MKVGDRVAHTSRAWRGIVVARSDRGHHIYVILVTDSKVEETYTPGEYWGHWPLMYIEDSPSWVVEEKVRR